MVEDRSVSGGCGEGNVRFFSLNVHFVFIPHSRTSLKIPHFIHSIYRRKEDKKFFLMYLQTLISL